MAPPPPELMDELVSEILLRLPPDKPEHLFRAALVSKPWFRILCDPDFLRRYRAFHRTPPLLGLLHRDKPHKVMQGDPEPRLAPTTAAPLSPYPDGGRSRALDCRHGRVLLEVGGGGWHFLVWDPLTGDKQRLPKSSIPWLIYSAAVLCATDGCDHLDCHGGPFRVVFIATAASSATELVKASVYSSETGTWSLPVSLYNGAHADEFYLYNMPYVQPRRVTLTGDDIYFKLQRSNTIIKYDQTHNCLSMINPPSPNADNCHIALMVMEDSSLGFACIEGSSLYLWSRKVNSKGAAEWVQFRVMELETTIPVANLDNQRLVVGFAEGVGVIFISTDVGLFTIEIKSGRARKVTEPGLYYSVLPYMSFYTLDRGRLS